MALVQPDLPDDIHEAIRRQIAGGRAASEATFLLEGARRYAEELAAEDEIVAEARAGIADAEAGRFITIATRADAQALHERMMSRVRRRLESGNE